MKITIKLFAGCKDIVRQASLTVNLPDQATAGAAFDHLVSLYPALERYRASLRLAVNAEFSGRDTVLRDGDELACIPPVSGGAYV